MQDFLPVQVSQGIRQLADVAQCLGFGQGAACAYQVFQRTVFNVLHDVVGRTVFLEYVVYADDVWIVERRQRLGLLQELLSEAVYLLACAFGKDTDLRVSFVPVAELFHEKFLDGHPPFQPLLEAEVGDSESALSQYGQDAVFSLVQKRSGLQLHKSVV